MFYTDISAKSKFFPKMILHVHQKPRWVTLQYSREKEGEGKSWDIVPLNTGIAGIICMVVINSGS